MNPKNIWKNFLMADIAGKAIGVFKDIFLGIYFLKITQGNIVDVSLYYIVFFMTYLIKRVNKDTNFQNYIAKDQMLKYTINLVLPIVLGYCISKSSYSLAFIVLIIMIAISFIFSLCVKGLSVKHGKINLKKFFNHINKNQNQKLMTWLSVRTLFRGVSSFGVLATLITIITFLVVSTELSLGSINSFITIISIFVVYVMNKFVKGRIYQ